MTEAPSKSPDKLTNLLDEMIEARNSVCQEFALTINHQHCIGCSLVMDYMKTHFPTMEYGSQAQWVEEAAFCALHERQMFRDFLRSKGVGK